MRASGQAVHPEFVDRMLQDLDATRVRSWFDVGLVLDQLRDNRKPPREDGLSADQLIQQAAQAAACLDAGSWGDHFAQLQGVQSSPWSEAELLFSGELERGGDTYNALITQLWSEVRSQAECIGRAVAEQQVQVLLVEQSWCDPQRLPTALALVFVSEALHLPVIARHQQLDERWMNNRHLGEIHTLVESVFPWDSPWAVHLVNSAQAERQLRDVHGINPARTMHAAPQPDLAEALRPIAEYAAGDGAHEPVVAAIACHRKLTRASADFEHLTRSQRRRYTPGLTELEYMVRLDSLIDPNAFRAEEKQLRGRCFAFAEARLNDAGTAIPEHGRLDYLAAVEYLFDYHVGTDELVVDHSLSYRHRNTWHYPYRKLTECELKGVIGKLAEEATTGRYEQQPQAAAVIEDFDAALVRVLGKTPILDHGARLQVALGSTRPMVWLPDSNSWQGFGAEAALLERFALPSRTAPRSLRIICRSQFGSGSIQAVAAYRLLNLSPAWAEAIRDGRVELIESSAICQGTHLAQLEDTASHALRATKEADGFVLSFGHANLLTLDLLDIESFRLGRCDDALSAAFMDLGVGDAYALWVPPALRPSLAYPTPVQSPRAFSEALLSEDFLQAVSQQGEAALLQHLAEDADRYGTPVTELLQRMAATPDSEDRPPVESQMLTGIHDNGAPWSGAYCRIRTQDSWTFTTVFAQSRSDTVLDLITQHCNAGGTAPALAWNGGYILNPELVGKLGLPEAYIGTPLGLLIEQGEIRALPLFNKPALAFERDGQVQIRPANLFNGLSVCVDGGTALRFDGGDRNLVEAERPVFFDLLHGLDDIPLRGRVAYRFAGRQILSVHKDQDSLPCLPVGLTVTVPEGQQPEGWVEGATVRFELPGWETVADAIEAGPKLLTDGQISIEMEQGGWTQAASIRTQAARLDYTHMRGPKIGVGMSEAGDLFVVAINGRIRESVGATHGELAKILLDMGADRAMGFDPGGSVTLVVNGRQLNISPYNRGYMQNPWSLPPQPRFVGNAILAVPR